MATTGKRASKTSTKKAVTKKAVANKAVAKKAVAKKAVAKKAVAKKAVAKKAVAKKAVAEKAPAKSKGSLLGSKAPAFELADQSGRVISSASLKGKPYVLYFYPKDNTPGCTIEACDFRDGMGNFRKAGVTIFGVSPDSVKSHAGFAGKFNLPFSLLSDPDKTLAQAYGVWALKQNYGREYWGIVRSTFLVGADGKVQGEWRSVKVKGHAAAVLAEAKS